VLIFAICTNAAAEDAGRFQWFTVPIEVRGLPRGAEFQVVSVRVDFTAWLAELQFKGLIDERAVRLAAIAPDGSKTFQSVQFLPDPQPRAKQRELLPGTGNNVSYLAEYGPGVAPSHLAQAGELAWIVRPPKSNDVGSGGLSGAHRFELEFGSPLDGSLVQVPFPPQNVRGFDPAAKATAVADFPRVQIHPQWAFDRQIEVEDLGKLVFGYHLGPDLRDAAPSLRRPFFYPLIGPDGVPLTEFGKPHDPTGSHAHHYSLWVAHALVNGKDFWSEKGGTIAHENFELMEDGPVFSRIIERNRWRDGGKDLLRERRTITVFQSQEPFRLIEIEIELTPASSTAVTFGKTSFGFLAARVAQSMTVFDGGGEIVNANGKRNEQQAHLQRAAWLDQSGPIAPGKWGGVALFDSPANPNFPTVWHCRNDGWAGASFNAEQESTLRPGETLRLRYGILLHSGNASVVQRRYAEFSARPEVAFEKPRKK